jgi:hypothetical protein
VLSNTGEQRLQAVSSITALTTLKLSLPASCAEDAEDAEAVCGLTTLTALRFHAKYEDGWVVEEVGEWKLDLSRLTSRLTSLNLEECPAVTDKEVLALSKVTGLVDLNLGGCINATSEGLHNAGLLPDSEKECELNLRPGTRRWTTRSSWAQRWTAWLRVACAASCASRFAGGR